MADERGDASANGASGPEGAEDGADGGEVSARLAELHRRSEELAERVASFRSDTEQLMTEAGGVDATAKEPDAAREPSTTLEPSTSQEPATDAERADSAPADSEPQAAPQARRPRPRPSADAPVKYADDAAAAGGAAGAAPAAEAEAVGKSEPETKPEAKSEADAKSDPEAKPEPKPEPKSEPEPEPKADAPTADKARNNKPKEGEPKEKRARRGLPPWVRKVRNLVVTVVVIVLAALALRTWVVAPFYVPSASMEPTLHGCPNCNNDHVLVQKIAYYFHDPRRGDIVVFSKPANWHVNDSDLIKRVIGVPGDKLSLRDGRVIVNGQRLDEAYVNHKCKRGTRPENGRTSWKVPKNRLFVMGDNRCDSEDSRQFGMVPIGNVVGEAFLIYWPVGHFGMP